MDLAVGHAPLTSGADITILLGNGDGSFRTAATYNVSGGVDSIASADLNRDGRLDLAVANGHAITIFIGNGDGSFRQQPDLPISGIGQMLRVADMNGDGFPDLVLADERLSVFLNHGDGTFESALDFPTGGAQALAIADFNRDGKPDVAVVDDISNPSLSFLLNGASLMGRDFQLTLSASSATVQAGQPDAMTISVKGIGLFNDAVTFTCTGLPAGATCVFSPENVSPQPNGSATANLTITTKAAPTAHLMRSSPKSAILALGLPVIGIILAGCFNGGKSRAMLAFVLLVLCLLALEGCAGFSASKAVSGGSGNGTPGTPAGTYTIVVTGTGGGSPVITHSLLLTLRVQ